MTLTLPYTFVTGATALAAEVNGNFSAVKTEVDIKVANALLTTKGDIIAATAASTPARLGVGTDRQMLVADSTASNGVKWQYEGELGTPNAQTGATYTFVLTDSAGLVTFSYGSAITATIPPNSSVAYPIGTQINILQIGAGQITVAGGSGVTLQSEASRIKTRAQYAMATVIKLGTNEWVVVGNVVA